MFFLPFTALFFHLGLCNSHIDPFRFSLDLSLAQGKYVDFSWVSTTSFTLGNYSLTAVGGFEPRKNRTYGAFVQKASAVRLFILEADPDEPIGFSVRKEIELDYFQCCTKKDKYVSFGMSLASLKVNQKTSVLVACDPLYFTTRNSGICFIYRFDLIEGHPTMTKKRKLPNSCDVACYSGLRLDIKKNSYREVPFIDELEYQYFGVDLKFLPRRTTPDFVRPLSHGLKYENFSQSITTPAPIVNTSFVRSFDGFGASLSIISETMVLVGAPYDSSRDSPNRGAVFLFCAANSSKLEGSVPNSFFGYSITSIGDVNFDGINDIAVSSPAFGTTNGQVSLFLVNKNCTLTLFQVLQTEDTQHTGISLSALIDFDGDGYEELALLSQKKINFRSVPASFKASCVVDPIFSLDAQITIKIRAKFKQNKEMENVKRFDYGLLKDAAFEYHLEPDVNFGRLKEDSIEALVLADSNTNASSRFTVEDLQLDIQSGPNPVVITAKLRSELALELIDARSTPIKVHFSTRTKDDYCQNNTCRKTQQPRLDWSECKQELKFYECQNSQEACRGDLSLRTEAPNLRIIPFGQNDNRNLSFSIRNDGSTTAKFAKIKITTSPRTSSISLMIEQVLFFSSKGDYITNSSKWDVHYFADRQAAWIYARMAMTPKFKTKFLVKYKVIGSALRGPTFMSKLQSDAPKMEIELSSELMDLNKNNNQFNIRHQFLYKPKLSIVGNNNSVIDDRRDFSDADQSELKSTDYMFRQV
ncbi:hypothetical protein Ciccas_004316 [Cichlidogyrus casuarinus]|uniref:Integrin alpha-2 domain-containing protein n=1 Tax=Cichlidogyrus casuarinus TaxID=1844966 RepID=A0ABD2QBV0_9PLAT